MHCIGGCVLGKEMLGWSSVMVALNGLPPDPEVEGDRWRDTWIERLEGSPPFVEPGSLISGATSWGAEIGLRGLCGDRVPCPRARGLGDGYTNSTLGTG